MLGDPASPLLWSSTGNQPDERSLPLWCTYTGQNEADARQWGWLQALHPDDRQTMRAHWHEILAIPHTITMPCQIRHFCQGYQAFNVQCIPVFDAAQQLRNWLIFFATQPVNPSPIDENWEIRLMYSMIFAQSVLGIFCLSLDGTIIRVNERFCQLTGYSETEMLKMTLWQLHCSEDVQLHLEAIQEHLNSGQSMQPFHVRYLRKEGTLTWVRVTQFLVRQPTGEPHYFFFIVEDVNAQVRAEKEHRELLARLQEAHAEAVGRTLQLEAVFEAMTDGVLVSDREGNIIRSNAAVKRLLHLEHCPNFLQMPITERLKLLKAVNENGQMFSAEEWPLARILRGETLQDGRAEDVHLYLPDNADIYVNHTGANIRDENNQIIGGVLVIHDVNERHILENRIHKSFRILLALAEELVDLPDRTILPAAICQPNQQPLSPHSFQAVSEYLAELTCQMLEYRGVSISLLDPDTERMNLIAIVGNLTEEEKAFYYNTFSSLVPGTYLKSSNFALLNENEVVVEELRHHIGDPHPYKVLLAPMMLEGHLVGILSVEKAEANASYTSEEFSLTKAVAKLILLVIERERVQNEWLNSHASELALREANRRFDDFLSIASHELRTPLAGIKGNIQLALRRLTALKSDKLPTLDLLLEKLSKVQEYLLQAEHRVNVQNRMISDLLDVSRIQANKLELVLGPCNLLQVVYEAIKDQQYTVPERAITLNVLDNQPVTIIGDADRLGQVIHNYLTNALKYSPPHQPVTVYITKKSHEVRVSVQDQGPGLTPEEQKRVWERFYRVKGIPALSGGQGLGLGLHICSTIIVAHQGTCGLDSAPGKGSTFWFTLPLTQTTG